MDYDVEYFTHSEENFDYRRGAYVKKLDILVMEEFKNRIDKIIGDLQNYNFTSENINAHIGWSENKINELISLLRENNIGAYHINKFSQIQRFLKEQESVDHPEIKQRTLAHQIDSVVHYLKNSYFRINVLGIEN